MFFSILLFAHFQAAIIPILLGIRSLNKFKTDVTGFITAMGQEVVSEYEFIQAGEHKSHLLMNVLDMEALEAEMTSDAAKEWDKKNNCKDTIYAIELV